MDKKSVAQLVDKSRRQIIMLTVIFVAGMLVNVLGMPPETEGTARVFSGIFTGLHVLVGIGLLVFGGVLVRVSYRGARRFVGATWSGLAAVLLAFASGMLMFVTDNDWWSFVMAVAFIAAFLIYGSVLLRAQKA